jgi:hypothetical protein
MIDFYCTKNLALGCHPVVYTERGQDEPRKKSTAN